MTKPIIGHFTRTALEAMNHQGNELRGHIREAVAQGEIDRAKLTGRDISNLSKGQCVGVLMGEHVPKSIYTTHAAAPVAPVAPVAPAADVAAAVQTMVDAIMAQQGAGAVDAAQVIAIAKTLTDPITVELDSMAGDIATVKTIADALARD